MHPDHVKATMTINTLRKHVLLTDSITKRNVEFQPCWGIEDVNQHARLIHIEIYIC